MLILLTEIATKNICTVSAISLAECLFEGAKAGPKKYTNPLTGRIVLALCFSKTGAKRRKRSRRRCGIESRARSDILRRGPYHVMVVIAPSAPSAII